MVVGLISILAWYTAENQAKAATKNAAASLATVKPASITENIEVSVLITRVDSGNLHLATAVDTSDPADGTNDAFVSKYELNGNYYTYTPSGRQFAIYSVAVKQTNQQDADKLHGSTVSITLGLNKKLNTGGTALEDAENSRAKGYITKDDTTAATAFNFSDNSLSIATSDSLVSNTLQSDNGQVVAYVFVYAEGANGASGADSTDGDVFSIYFGVTVSGNNRS